MAQVPPGGTKGTKRMSREQAMVLKMAETVARLYDELNEEHHPVLGSDDEIIIYQRPNVSDRDCVILRCLAEECLGCKTKVIRALVPTIKD
jgi:hypothetical protein